MTTGTFNPAVHDVDGAASAEASAMLRKEIEASLRAAGIRHAFMRATESELWVMVHGAEKGRASAIVDAARDRVARRMNRRRRRT